MLLFILYVLLSACSILCATLALEIEVQMLALLCENLA